MRATGVRTVRNRIAPALQTAPFVLLVLLLFAVPSVLLVVGSLRQTTFFGEQSGLTLANYRDLLADDVIITLLRRTLTIAGAVAVLTTGLAVAVGHALAFRLSARTARAVLAVILAGAVFSFVVRVLSWAMVLGDRGVLNRVLESVGVVSASADGFFYSPTAVVIVMTYVSLPLAVLLVLSSMQDIDPRQLEASRDLGCGRLRTLLRVVLPQARLGVAGAFALTAVLAASDYIVPSLVGGRRGQTLGNAIYREFTDAGAYGRGAALAILSVLSAIIAVGILLVLVALVARMAHRHGSSVDRFAVRLAAAAPGRWSRTSLSTVATLLTCAALLLPALLVVVFSFNDADALGLPFDGFTTRWYPTIVDRPGFADALQTSLLIAVSATVISVVIGVPAALALQRTGALGRRVLMGCVGLTFAVPPAMLGAGIFTVAVDYDLPLGGALTTAVQVAFVTPVVVLVVHGRMQNLDSRIFEAARDLGSAPLDVMRRLTLPLLLPTVVGAAALGMAYALDEVVVTNYTIGTSATVPTWLFARARNAFTPEINALGVIMFAITAGLLLVAAAARRSAGRAQR